MYEELIRKFNPKPKFNLKWYKNEDLYSEGEIEDHIMELIGEKIGDNQVVQSVLDKINNEHKMTVADVRKCTVDGEKVYVAFMCTVNNWVVCVQVDE